MNERIVHLRVPRSELLLSTYHIWERYVLEGVAPTMATTTAGTCPAKRARVPRATAAPRGKAMFDISDDPNTWQGVLDRIEAAWLVEIVDENDRALISSIRK